LYLVSIFYILTGVGNLTPGHYSTLWK